MVDVCEWWKGMKNIEEPSSTPRTGVNQRDVCEGGWGGAGEGLHFAYQCTIMFLLVNKSTN
jgi:hypothetical protein